MTANKRLTNLSDYKSVLPYSSELFGIYQPMIGWKSKRAKEWISRAAKRTGVSLIDRFVPYFQNRSMIEVNADCTVNTEGLGSADFRGPRLIEQNSVLLKEVQKSLAESPNDLSIANCRSIFGQVSAVNANMERARRENALGLISRPGFPIRNGSSY